MSVSLVDNRPRRKYIEGTAECGRCKRSTKVFAKLLGQVHTNSEHYEGMFEDMRIRCTCQPGEGFVCTVVWDL